MEPQYTMTLYLFPLEQLVANSCFALRFLHTVTSFPGLRHMNLLAFLLRVTTWK
jgi:hypothetical protein